MVRICVDISLSVSCPWMSSLSTFCWKTRRPDETKFQSNGILSKSVIWSGLIDPDT